MKHKSSWKVAWIFVITLPAFLISCYPDGPSSPEDMDLVTTSYDEDFSFSDVTTFSLPDTVIYIFDDVEEDSQGHDHDSLIISRIREHMIGLGYQEEPLDALNPADVVLLVSATFSSTSGLYYDPAWWWGYWGWWPGWGAYPGAPLWGTGWGMGFPLGFPIYIEYATGTLFITMVDPENTDTEEETIAVTWLAAINGLLSGSSLDMAQRITDNIDQAFQQSPYLKNN